METKVKRLCTIDVNGKRYYVHNTGNKPKFNLCEYIKDDNNYKTFCIIVLVIFTMFLSALVIMTNLDNQRLISENQMLKEELANKEKLIDYMIEDRGNLLDDKFRYMDIAANAKAELEVFNSELIELRERTKSALIPDNTNISNFSLLTPTNYTIEELDEILVGTGFEGYGEAYYQAEKETGINSVFLISLSALESGWNTSTLAKQKNNVFGWQAYDDNFDSAKTFNDVENSIIHCAKGIKELYLTKGGKYHYGYGLEAMNMKYSTSSTWAYKVGRIMLQLYDKLEV